MRYILNNIVIVVKCYGSLIDTSNWLNVAEIYVPLHERFPCISQRKLIHPFSRKAKAQSKLKCNNHFKI